jgi:hypothetical protein
VCKLLVWMDAKFSGGHEKSYCKVALHSEELFPLYRSNISRYIDIDGHESAFLSLADQITVCIPKKHVVLNNNNNLFSG